jgi:hypothetical protein
VVPLSIARSLVSVASDVKDTSRKVCLETLRYEPLLLHTLTLLSEDDGDGTNPNLLSLPYLTVSSTLAFMLSVARP